VGFELKRAVDLPGLVCADLHQHAARSPDSAVPPLDRVASNLAEGLDVQVATEHNFVADYSEQAIQLSTAAPLLFLSGEEVTREGVGHFNAWPMKPKPDGRGGAIDVRDKNAHQLLAKLRAPDRVVQVNHPRAGNIGYFNLVNFDPTGAALPRELETGFDAVEVLTGKEAQKSDQPLADWMSLMNHNIVLTAVGGSDSHLLWGQEVGYPRTCVFLDGKPTVEALVAAVKQSRAALVTTGPFVTVSAAGHGMGQLVPAPRGRARLDVEVRAAPWVDTKKLELWVNGGRRGKPIDLPPGRGPVRYKGSIELKIEHDAAVVVIVRGDATLAPVVSQLPGAQAPTPIAITNPIFLDRDGDGRFTGPLAPAPPRPGSAPRPGKGH
jgi:hypothetical protein